MRDVNDLNHEYLEEKTFRLKYYTIDANPTYIGKFRTDEWMVKKILTNSTTSIGTTSVATKKNNSYDNLEDAWTNKLTLTYE